MHTPLLIPIKKYCSIVEAVGSTLVHNLFFNHDPHTNRKENFIVISPTVNVKVSC